jgi:hypothetical protein
VEGGVADGATLEEMERPMRLQRGMVRHHGRAPEEEEDFSTRRAEEEE